MEQLAAGTSSVHKLSPTIKLIMTLVYIICVISFPGGNVSGPLPYLLYPACMMPLALIPPKPFLTRLLIAVPFALFGGISNMFLLRDTAFVFAGIHVTEGVLSFSSIMLKTLLSVSAVLVLAATTPFASVCRVLSKMKLPGIICLQLLLTYRYIAVLIGEAVTAVTAYRLRAPMKRGVVISHAGSFLGVLMLRSFDRAERIYQAMLCRGFDGSFDWLETNRIQAPDIICGSIVIAASVLFRIFNVPLLLGEALI